MEEKKNILFLAEWFPHPGDPQLGVFIEKHARAAALNFSITVIHIVPVTSREKKYGVFQEKKEFHLIRVSYRRSFSRLINYFRYRKAFKMALGHSPRPDLVHLHVCGKNAIGRKLFLKNIPYAVTEHWSGYLKNENNFLTVPAVAKLTFRNAKLVTVPSEHLKNSLEKITGRKDIIVLPNVIEESAEPLNKPEITSMLVVADMVDEIKNVSGILDALKIISEKATNDFRLDVKFIGSGKDKEELVKKAKGIQAGKINIAFENALPNTAILDELKRSSFLVVNSRRETFSMVTAEALLAGIPVIATRCGGPEKFVDESNGILIDTDDNHALAEAIIYLCKNHRNYDPAKISRPIRKQYSLNAIGDLLVNMYNL